MAKLKEKTQESQRETHSQYFSLLRGIEIAPAQSTHRIPAEEFSQLINGRELLQIVQKDASNYKLEIAKECEQIKEEAYKDGFQAGSTAWSEMVGLLEKEIMRVREEMQRSIMPIAVKAAKKIVGAEIKLRPDAIIDIVMSTAKIVAQHKKIVLYVSRPDFEQVESNKNQLKKIFEELESLSIRQKDDLIEGDCIIETEGGIINARLKDRWVTMEAALKSMQESLQSKLEVAKGESSKIT